MAKSKYMRQEPEPLSLRSQLLVGGALACAAGLIGWSLYDTSKTDAQKWEEYNARKKQYNAEPCRIDEIINERYTRWKEGEHLFSGWLERVHGYPVVIHSFYGINLAWGNITHQEKFNQTKSYQCYLN